MVRPYPSQERIAQLFDYQADGKLVWRIRPMTDFKSRRGWSIFNTRYAGKVAGCNSKPKPGLTTGYVVVRVNDVLYAAHRLIWILHHGDIPLGLEIDHERGVRNDNRIERLLLVTHAQNNQNQRRQANNKSGISGVRWNDATGSWRAEGQANGVRRHLGLFASLDAAPAAIQAFRATNGFSPFHGRAA